MREIKFRAWHKREKEMLDVTAIETFDHEYVYYRDGLITNKGPVRGEYIELMQYTGLKDKNDVEIFVGDNILIPYDEVVPVLDDGSGPLETNNIIGQVVKDHYAFGVNIKQDYSPLEKGFHSFLYINDEYGLDQIEIIGNKYELWRYNK